MFDSTHDHEQEGLANPRRRAFLVSAATAAIGGLALWQWKKPAVLQAAPAAAGEPKEVTVVLFSDTGQRQKQVRIAKVVRTEDEWRKQLSGNAFDITRHADTEIAFSGKYWTCTTKACTAASAATTRSSIPPPSSNRARGGQVSGRQSPPRT